VLLRKVDHVFVTRGSVVAPVCMCAAMQTARESEWLPVAEGRTPRGQGRTDHWAAGLQSAGCS